MQACLKHQTNRTYFTSRKQTYFTFLCDVHSFCYCIKRGSAKNYFRKTKNPEQNIDFPGKDNTKLSIWVLKSSFDIFFTSLLILFLQISSFFLDLITLEQRASCLFNKFPLAWWGENKALFSATSLQPVYTT